MNCSRHSALCPSSSARKLGGNPPRTHNREARSAPVSRMSRGESSRYAMRPARLLHLVDHHEPPAKPPQVAGGVVQLRRVDRVLQIEVYAVARIRQPPRQRRLAELPRADQGDGGKVPEAGGDGLRDGSGNHLAISDTRSAIARLSCEMEAEPERPACAPMAPAASPGGHARARTVQCTRLGSTRNSGSGWPAPCRSRRAAGMPNPYRCTKPSTRIASARMGLR